MLSNYMIHFKSRYIYYKKKKKDLLQEIYFLNV